MNKTVLKKILVFSAFSATSAIIAIFIISGVLQYSNIYMKEKVEHAIDTAQKKLGVKIKIENKSQHMTRVRFENVEIPQKFRTVISNITGTFNTNPLSLFDTPIRLLQIDGIRTKIELKELKDLFKDYMNKPFPSDELKAASPFDFVIFKKIPEKIEASLDFLEITDSSNETIFAIRGLKISYSKFDALLNFRFDSIIHKNKNLSGPAGGQLITHSQSSYYPLLFYQEAQKPHASWSIKGKLAKDFSSIKIYLKSFGIPLDLFPQLKDIIFNASTVNYASSVFLARGNKDNQLEFSISLGSIDLAIKHPLISSREIGPIPFQIMTKGFYDFDKNEVTLSNGTVKLQNRVSFSNPASTLNLNFSTKSISLSNPDSTGYLEFTATLNPTKCQTFISTLPSTLIPNLKSFDLSGEASFKLHLKINPNDPANFYHNFENINANCSALSTAYEFSRSRLLSQFPISESGKEIELPRYGDKKRSISYSILSDISKSMKDAIISSEDGGFWNHNGVDFESILAAIRKNIKEGKISIGGSTITMQTAKNLFLGPERTISRKLQEIFLSIYLEKILPKEKILEIYLNIIEYGPEIFGIKNASIHYFNKMPKDLSPLESSFLVSIIPSPVKRYKNYCNGMVSKGLRSMMDHSLARMSRQGNLEDTDFKKALKEDLVFNGPKPMSPMAAECLKHISSTETASPTGEKFDF
ncbi:MAG: transglycosylase domain-containing protein [Oligoflexales bacterium]|nr:transglycosylase domain-containing protein [Oligoflexales bacterium]